MAGFSVDANQLGEAAGVYSQEAETAYNALIVFKGQVQQLQDTYQAVPPDDWNALMTDLDIYTNEFREALHAIASGLSSNSVNYSDIEAANAKLVSIDGYTPITDVVLASRIRVRAPDAPYTPLPK